MIAEKNNKHSLLKYAENYSLILLYITYVTFYIKNSPNELNIIFSIENLSFLVLTVVFQIIWNSLLWHFDKRAVKVLYILIIFISFIFLDLTYFIIYLNRAIEHIFNIVSRFRFLLFALLVISLVMSYWASKHFLKFLRLFNTFLWIFLATNVLLGIFSVYKMLNDSKRIATSNYRHHNIDNGSESQRTSAIKKNILFIVTDEYSSPYQISKATNDSLSAFSFWKYLKSKGFLVKPDNRTLEISTINSINEIFNYNSGLTFENKSIENTSLELKKASVIKELELRGYKFKNFGFFNIADHKEFYYLYPFPHNNWDILFKYSLLPILIPNLNLNNFKDINFSANADYNKNIEVQSLTYINEVRPDTGYLTYVHFLMPHAPFFMENEFPDKPINLQNYISYWYFCNKKISGYLNSIKDINSYKIIITGDHGFRADKKINPYRTMSSFYNFDQKEIDKINTVQDIGNLLLSQ